MKSYFPPEKESEKHLSFTVSQHITTILLFYIYVFADPLDSEAKEQLEYLKLRDHHIPNFKSVFEVRPCNSE